jgi:hypothetical protein
MQMMCTKTADLTTCGAVIPRFAFWRMNSVFPAAAETLLSQNNRVREKRKCSDAVKMQRLAAERNIVIVPSIRSLLRAMICKQ